MFPFMPASLGSPLAAVHVHTTGAAALKHDPVPLLPQSTPNTGHIPASLVHPQCDSEGHEKLRRKPPVDGRR